MAPWFLSTGWIQGGNSWQVALVGAILGDMARPSLDAALLRLERHDRLQLELKVEQPSPGPVERHAEYEVDVWFWLPQATGISAADYPPSLFYEDLRVHSRLKTPDVPLDQLCRPDGAGSPLAVLEAILGRVGPEGPLAGDFAQIEAEPKLLCAILKSRLRDGFADLTDELVVPRAQELERDLNQLRLHWRRTKERLLENRLPRDLRWSLFFCDESLSIQMEGAALRAIALLADQDEVPAGLEKALRKLAVSERSFREEQGWRSVLRQEGSKRDDEAVLDQGRLLKKYWSSVLHLVSEPNPWDGVWRQGAFAVAAGLAMIWAVAAQVVMLVTWGLQIQQGVGVSFIVTFTVLATAAYMLKDRIKATTSAALQRRLPRYFDDRRMLLMTDRDAKPLAMTSERVRFAGPSTVPEPVTDRREETLRNKLLLDTRQDVLHYRRRVEQHPRAASRQFSRFDGLTEVLRFNVWRWVRTYAEPRRMLELLDGDGKVKSKRVDNRYFVDVVVRYRRRSPDPVEVLSHHLLVLDRRGIVRVDSLEAGQDAA